MELIIVGLFSNWDSVLVEFLGDGAVKTPRAFSSSSSMAKVTEGKQDALIKAKAVVATNNFEKEKCKLLIYNTKIILTNTIYKVIQKINISRAN